LYLNGVRRFILFNADLDSFQDTLLVNATGDQAYFRDNHIQGDTDFIWGSGTAFFTNCDLETLTSGNAANYQNITQPRTVAGTNGLSFVNCTLTRRTNSIYGGLGRSLGFADGNAAYINCLIDAHIVGWQDPQARYWEFGNSNLSATMPTNFNGTQLAATDPNLTNAETANLWLYGWQPALAPNIIGQPANASVSAGQSANFIVTAIGIPDPTYQWYLNGQPLIGATGTNYMIASAVRTNAGNYVVVVSNASGSVTSLVATLTYTGNVAPVVNPSTYVRPAGSPLNIPIVGSLATNWSDADADPLALTGAISSTNGALVSYDTSYVYYTNANDVADEIDYTVGDGQGGNTPGAIEIVIGPPPTNSIATTVVNGDGSVTLSFVGVPNYRYQVEATASLTPPAIWAAISTNTADGGGLWQVTDTQATNYPQRFYRAVYRP